MSLEAVFAPATGDDTVLYGHDATPRLVAVHSVGPATETDQALMRVYRRDASYTTLTTEDVPFYPFFFSC